MTYGIARKAPLLAILFSVLGQPASASTPAEVNACVDRNDVTINFIVTRTLMPRSANTPATFGSESGDKAFPIIIGSGSAYVEFRSDGLQGASTRNQLLSLCKADPKMDLPRELMKEIMSWLSPAPSLIEIETQNAVERRDIRHKFLQGGAAHIPNYIDRPKAP